MLRYLCGGIFAAALLAAAPVFAAGGDASGSSGPDELHDPLLGQPKAIEEGLDLYRAHCLICHRNRGGRGPNLFETKLSDEQFAATVLAGREGFRGKMPAFGVRLSLEEVWKVLAYIRSTDHY